MADADAARESPLDAACGAFLRHLNGASEVILVTAQGGPDVSRAAFLLRSRGAHVTVALVNAAAFGAVISSPAERNRVPFSPILFVFSGDYKRRRLAGERTARRTKSAAVPDYQAQSQVLRESGFAVALIPKEASVEESGAAQMALLRAGVREVVEPPLAGRRAAA